MVEVELDYDVVSTCLKVKHRMTYSRSTEDLDGNEVGFLGNTIGRTTNSASDVSTVACIIDVGATNKVLAERGTTTKFSVINVDARINDIAISASTGGSVVVVSVGSIVTLRDAAETPRAASLGGNGSHVDRKIFFDNSHLDIKVRILVIHSRV